MTRTTLELLNWWRRDGRQQRLFFAQLEAAETIIFLSEARAGSAAGHRRSARRAERRSRRPRATRLPALRVQDGDGLGKTTVMGMLAAWSILNKVNERADGRFSDVGARRLPERHDPQPARELDPALARRASIARATWCRRT